MKLVTWLLHLAVCMTVTAEYEDVASWIQDAIDFVPRVIDKTGDFPIYLYGIAQISSLISAKLGNDTDARLEEMANLLVAQYDKLDKQIDIEFDDLRGLANRKHFEKIITDPTTILWNHAMQFLTHRSNESNAKMRARCEVPQHKPVDLLNELETHIFGPNNTLDVQTRAFKFDDGAFQKTKTLIEYRLFQILTVEAMCRSILLGPNTTMSTHPQIRTLQTKFNRIVKSIRDFDEYRKAEYWPETAEIIIKKELDKKTGDNTADARKILNLLEKMYPWNKFVVILYDNVSGDDNHYVTGSDTIKLFPYAGRNIVVYKSTSYMRHLKTLNDAKRDDMQEVIRKSYKDDGGHASMGKIMGAVHRIPSFYTPFEGLIKVTNKPSFWSDSTCNRVACEYSDPEVAVCQWIEVTYSPFWFIERKNTIVYITGY